ncbi:MAG TPA: SDR family oxidoreductase [Dehalococcoidia bacterium]|nr:SDR family oxidoreductase [Dehalococcoidia bacterium]
MPSLRGQVALITGGGRGLGEAIGRRLARDGAHVYLLDARESCHDVARQIGCEGGAARGIVADLTDASAAERAVAEVAGQAGRLDVLVNNAGIDVTAPVDAIDVASWDRVLAVNLRAPFILSRAAMRHMGESGGGAIVNIASTASRRAWANASAYHASKWGLLGLSHALHVEGRERNVRVSAIIAGGMRTPFLLDRFPDIDEETLQDPANVAEAVRFVLCQPPGTVIPEMLVLPARETSWP